MRRWRWRRIRGRAVRFGLRLGPLSPLALERGKAGGEFRADTNAELLVESLIGPIYFRLLLRHAPLTERYGEELVDQVLRGVLVSEP